MMSRRDRCRSHTACRDQNVSVLLTGAAGTTDLLSGMVTQSGFTVEIGAVEVSSGD